MEVSLKGGGKLMGSLRIIAYINVCDERPMSLGHRLHKCKRYKRYGTKAGTSHFKLHLVLEYHSFIVSISKVLSRDVRVPNHLFGKPLRWGDPDKLKENLDTVKAIAPAEFEMASILTRD